MWEVYIRHQAIGPAAPKTLTLNSRDYIDFLPSHCHLTHLQGELTTWMWEDVYEQFKIYIELFLDAKNDYI